MTIKTPCSDCARRETCEKTSCRKWEMWFSGYWRALRRKYLNTDKEEKK